MMVKITPITKNITVIIIVIIIVIVNTHHLENAQTTVKMPKQLSHDLAQPAYLGRNAVW